jgi:uncharacterized UBP type Zn finger protein
MPSIISSALSTCLFLSSQFTKVGAALASDSQGCLANPKQSVSPWMLKKLCGMRHPEFATCQQQDAQEFLSFLIDQVAREEHGNKDRIGDANFENNFKMGLQTRIQCQESHRVCESFQRRRSLGFSR